MGDHQGFVDAVGDFPNVAAYWRTSILPLLVATVLKVDTVSEWVGLHVVVTVLLFVYVAVVLWRRMTPDDALVAFGFFLLGSIGAVLLGGIGFYDVWVVAEAVLIVTGTRGSCEFLGR